MRKIKKMQSQIFYGLLLKILPPQFIGCYGDKDASTPNIDRLAKEGVRFTNAFSTGTVCSPSRCTIITGVRTYKMGTGNHRSHYPIPDFIRGFPYYLRKAGYYTSNNVKTDYNVKNPQRLIKEAWNESSNKAGWWKPKPGQPFFAVFNYIDSHQSRTMTYSYPKYLKEVLDQLPDSDKIGEKDFKMPPFYRDSPEMRKQFARVYNSIKLTDNKIGELLKKLEQDHLTDSTIIFFYADHGEGIPRGKTNGINLGYRVPFVIWFPPMYKNLSPWGTGGVVSDEIIDFEDLASTLISLVGGNIPNYLKGRILMGDDRSKPVDHILLSSDRSDNGIDMIRSVTNGHYIYCRNFMPFMPEVRYIRYMEIGDIKQQMRRDLAAHKLNVLQKKIFEPRPAEFLFDIDHDKWETRNLVDEPNEKGVLQKMRNQLANGILDARDVMFLPEYEIGLISKTTTPYEFRLSDKNYPIKEIYGAASLSGKRGVSVAKEQVKLLINKDKIVRYWAMIGLRSQPPSVLTPYKSEIINSMKDNYPPVSVTASAIAYQQFNDKTAEQKLKKYIKDENMDIALMAINYLLYVDNKRTFIEAVQSAHDETNSDYNVKAACQDFLGSLGIVPNNPAYEK